MEERVGGTLPETPDLNSEIDDPTQSKSKPTVSEAYNCISDGDICLV